jgi:hypothetical protein
MRPWTPKGGSTTPSAMRGERLKRFLSTAKASSTSESSAGEGHVFVALANYQVAPT